MTATTSPEGATSPGATTTPLKGIRKVAARRMIEAWAVPVFHLTVEVDMTRALGTKERTPGATVTDALLAACTGALRAHPPWRPVAELTLTCDHRAVDGATGAAFLGTLRELLQ